MVKKLITFCLAAMLSFAILAIVGCSNARGAPKLEKASADVLQLNKQTVAPLKVTTFSVHEMALLSNKTVAVLNIPSYGISTANTSGTKVQRTQSEYHSLYDTDIGRPPSFNGLGGNHFARADV